MDLAQSIYAMLCYAMLCHAMLCYAMPCHAMPRASPEPPPATTTPPVADAAAAAVSAPRPLPVRTLFGTLPLPPPLREVGSRSRSCGLVAPLPPVVPEPLRTLASAKPAGAPPAVGPPLIVRRPAEVPAGTSSAASCGVSAFAAFAGSCRAREESQKRVRIGRA
jgi:hypothetical protein